MQGYNYLFNQFYLCKAVSIEVMTKAPKTKTLATEAPVTKTQTTKALGEKFWLGGLLFLMNDLPSVSEMS